MDLVRLPTLRQIKLRLAAEGGRAIYLAQDLSTGRIFTLPAKVAHAVRNSQIAVSDPRRAADAKASVDEEVAKEVYGFLHMMKAVQATDLLKRKPFNPLFMNLPLFDLGPWQRHLQGLARLLVGWQSFVALALLAVLCFSLGARNNWAILDAFQNVFSLQALLSFGLVAPFLKLIHEVGHVLTATRYGVRVRQFGVMVIGLYPMPFVDCSDADMTARRRHRVAISLAGIVTDVFIGLIAFALWHVTEGNFFHVLLGNIFVFSTLNSILFNANPLIKLDGYYALTDALGRRNFYTRAIATLSGARDWVVSFGAQGQSLRGWRRKGLAGYALATVLYRVNILWIIASAMMPKYLGLGAVLTAWGALAMFALPLMRDRPQNPTTDRPKPTRVWGWRLGILSVLVAGLFLLKWPFSTVVPVSLDITGSYQITVRSPGFVEMRAGYGPVSAGQVILQQDNVVLADELAMLTEELRGAALLYEAVRGADPAKAQAAQEKIASLQERQANVLAEQANLTLTAAATGVFMPLTSMEARRWLGPGDPAGALLPREGAAVLTGAFPERYVTLYRGGVAEATLKVAGQYQSVPISGLDLSEVMQRNSESGARSWQLRLSHEAASAAQMVGQPGQLRLSFERAPAWRHLQFWWQGVVEKYRSAQLIERETLLD